jgi:hypothetical protein
MMPVRALAIGRLRSRSRARRWPHRQAAALALGREP